MALTDWIAGQYGILRSAAIYHRPGRMTRLAEFYRPLVPAGGLAFDIGAHLGNRTRAWRRLGTRVVAVEPHPDLVRWLARGFRRDGDVTVLPVALGRQAGDIDLHIPPGNPTVSTTSGDWMRSVGRTQAFARVRWRRTERVGQMRLDDLIDRFGLPDFIKIDVEGAEADVLAGLTHPIGTLSFEVVPSAKSAALACLDELARLGTYRFRFSAGESLRWDWPEWRDDATVRGWINQLPETAPSGDVYARLERTAA